MGAALCVLRGAVRIGRRNVSALEVQELVRWKQWSAGDCLKQHHTRVFVVTYALSAPSSGIIIRFVSETGGLILK